MAPRSRWFEFIPRITRHRALAPTPHDYRQQMSAAAVTAVGTIVAAANPLMTAACHDWPNGGRQTVRSSRCTYTKPSHRRERGASGGRSRSILVLGFNLDMTASPPASQSTTTPTNAFAAVRCAVVVPVPAGCDTGRRRHTPRLMTFRRSLTLDCGVRQEATALGARSAVFRLGRHRRPGRGSASWIADELQSLGRGTLTATPDSRLHGRPRSSERRLERRRPRVPRCPPRADHGSTLGFVSGYRVRQGRSVEGG